MNDKNYERFAGRIPYARKMRSGVAVVIVAVLLPGMAIAESEIENNAVEQTLTVDRLVIDSQPLNVNIVPVAQEAELTPVHEPEQSSPAPVQLALAEQADHGQTGVAKGVGAIAAVSPLSVVDGESSQIPFALVLALLALIAVVPMSRRH